MTLSRSPDVALPLRERKKLATRRLLIACSHELFLIRGFRGTTLEDIAESAEVTVRTLLRYFPTKEDLALALEQQAFERLRETLSAPRGGETALAVWHRFMADLVFEWKRDPSVLEYELFLETDPSLVGRTLSLVDSYEELLARHIAADFGLDLVGDMTAWVAAAVAVHGANRLSRLWAAHPEEVDPLDALAAITRRAQWTIDATIDERSAGSPSSVAPGERRRHVRA